jgi:hypothetical protein
METMAGGNAAPALAEPAPSLASASLPEPAPSAPASRKAEPIAPEVLSTPVINSQSNNMLGDLLESTPELSSFELAAPPEPANGRGAKMSFAETLQSDTKASSGFGTTYDDMSEYESAAQLDQFEPVVNEPLLPEATSTFESSPKLREPQETLEVREVREVPTSKGGFFDQHPLNEPEPKSDLKFETKAPPAKAPQAAEPTESASEPIPEAKDLIKKMEEMTKTVTPDWCETFSFPDLDDLRKERDSLAETIRQTQSRISVIDNKLAMLDGLKNALLAADGEDLKNACSRVFKRLGWTSKQSEADSRELLLSGDETTEVIARIVRSSSSAPRPDVAQLAQSVLTYWGDTEIEPKGVLIASTFVLTAPRDRYEQDFSDALADFAQKKSLCLMTTVQLLCMYRDLELGKLEADQIRNRILDANGRLTGFELEPLKSTVV